MNTIVHNPLELTQAQELQKEARRLHLPVFPVVSWEAEKIGIDGKIREKIISKSNSYVRNGLNVMAAHSAYAYLNGSSYIDGSFALKDINGNLNSSTDYLAVNHYVFTNSQGESYFEFVAGYGNTAESVDDWKLVNLFATGSSVNQLTKGVTSRSTTWSAGSKKVITDISRMFTNAYSANQDIKEIGLNVSLAVSNGGSSQCLVLRDVLASIVTLIPGESILFHYKFEVLY